MLTPSHLDYAVAKGATYYAKVQAEGGVKVKKRISVGITTLVLPVQCPRFLVMAPPVDAILRRTIWFRRGFRGADATQ